MSERIAAHQVGAPDPEKRTSPNLDDTDAYHAAQAQQLRERAGGYRNDGNCRRGAQACIGAELSRGQDSLWLRQGSCAPIHP